MTRKLDCGIPNSGVGPLSSPFHCPVSRQRGARWHLPVSYVSLGNGVRDALFEAPLWPPVLIFFEPLDPQASLFSLIIICSHFLGFPTSSPLMPILDTKVSQDSGLGKDKLRVSI